MTHVVVISRAAPVLADVDDDPVLDEAHWSYLDRFTDGMIARGPLLATDRSTWAGSMHIIELPRGAEVGEFVADFVEREPYNQAGRFADHVALRFSDALDRTMWQWKPPAGDSGSLFLVTALARAGGAVAVGLPALAPADLHRTVVLGELSTLADARPAGVLWALQAAGRDSIDALLTAWPAARDDQVLLEVHDWEFGGRR